MARAHTFPTVLGGLLALALTPAFWPTGAAAGALCPDTEDVQLTVGQSNDAGDVKVCNGVDSEGEFLRVTYEATYPFCLLDTQLHVATIPEAPAEPDDNIPQNPQGRPTPDEFSDFGLPDEGCQGTATYTIPLAAIGEEVVPGDTVAIAARADLEDEDGKAEEAWGAGTPFVDRGSWATYFTYTLQVPSCDQPGVEGASCTVFVTSTIHTGALGGLAGGDAICNTRADEAGLPGDYKAWLSEAGGASPASRFTKSHVPYKRTDGVTIARDWDWLVEEGPDVFIDRVEDGRFYGDTEGDNIVWTGTWTDGLPLPGYGADELSCRDWTVLRANGLVGDFTETRGTFWTASIIEGCGHRNRLYCFEQ